jgi:hypothetical protein
MNTSPQINPNQNNHNNHNSHNCRKLLTWSATGILFFILLTFLFRNTIISFYLHHKIDRFNQQYDVSLTFEKTKVRNLTSVLISGIILKPQKGDTLLKIDSAYATVNFWKLLRGRFKLNELQLKNTSISFIRHDSINNYFWLLEGRKNKNSEDTTITAVNYATKAKIFFNGIFDKIPESLTMDNFTVHSSTNGHEVMLHFDQWITLDHQFKTTIRVTENGSEAVWLTEGRIDNDAQMISFRLYPKEARHIILPYLQYRWNAEIGFDTLTFSLAEGTPGSDLTVVNGTATARGLEIADDQIAANKVLFNKLGIDYTVNFGKDYAELDSASLVTFNALDFHPFLKYRPHPSKQITLKLHMPDFPAEALFSSIPQGLFTNFNGIRVKGNLTYNLHFFVNLSEPDSLLFESDLARHQFSILSFGETDLTRINGPFLYTAYVKEQPVRTFMVGPENPNYRSLDKISPYLQASVLCSEDGGFYQHRGLSEEAFRNSIIANIKERRFVRGGSTITMQLVKNVFLQHTKTIGRKLEEMLLVWLIENQGLTTKDRMYEVYLNIIEWGPMIYGANEAARFYFNKDASKLTLAESIFLASIIPRPRWFQYSFDQSGQLRESNAGFYKLLSEKMLRKGQITQEDVDKLVPSVDLKGPARLLLKKVPAVPPADSLFNEDDQ